MADSIYYEHPLNERIRNLLRLEFLCQQYSHAASGPTHWDTRAALHALFDILEFISRSDLKSELTKELGRHAAVLKRLQKTPGIDTDALEAVLGDIQQASAQIKKLNNAMLETLRQHEFLSAIRQRSSIPGGTCKFDLPALHLWLEITGEQQKKQLDDWFWVFRPLQRGAALVLRLIRASAVPSQELAEQGFFEKALDGNTANQLVQVILAPELALYPEISGSKHRLSIRFIEQADADKRARKSTQDIEFKLVCCAI